MADGLIKLSGELDSQTAEGIVADCSVIRGIGANVESVLATFGTSGNYKTVLAEELSSLVEGTDYADNASDNTQFKNNCELKIYIYKGGSFILEG